MKRSAACFVLFFPALLALSGHGCTTPAADVADAGAIAFDRKALLSDFANHVVLDGYRDFLSASTALKDAAAARASANTAPSRELARAAWRAAMSKWQEAEVWQLGPAGPTGAVVGGDGLRDEIYSWPTVNPCRVDQELVAKNYGNAGFFDTALVNAYGLAALEYLLFVDGEANACPSTAAINTNGTWAALPPADRTQRRLDYAAVVASHLESVARKLVGAWDPADGGFGTKLENAGTPGSEWKTAQAAIDEVFSTMFYVDFITKDLKLAAPSGLDGQCAAASCPDKLESRFAHHSKENVVANLRGLRRLLTGGAPGETDRIGFDDYLLAAKADTLAVGLIADLDAAIAKAEATPGSFEESLTRDPAEIKAIHAAVKKVTDTLKSQFVTVLNLKVPQEGAGDND